MNQLVRQDRLVWSFWAAGAIAVVGGLLPLLIGGTSSRMATVIIPFAVAAGALIACGFFYKQGRALSALLYFAAGLALVYGMLAMFAVPLELAVLGSCAAPPAPCTGGLGRPLSVAENTGMGAATGFGVAALFVGFFGLMVVFRKPALTPPSPPVRNIPPVKAPEPAKPVPVAVAAAVAPKAEPEPEPELPAHEEEEWPELPPHESSPSST